MPASCTIVCGPSWMIYILAALLRSRLCEAEAEVLMDPTLLLWNRVAASPKSTDFMIIHSL